MSIGRPDGPYVDRLLASGAWPDVNEDLLYDRATACTRALQDLTFGSAEPWAHELNETFDGGIWTGGAAGAANGKAKDCGAKFDQQQNHLVAASTWNSHVAGMVANAKAIVTNNVREAQELIADIETSDDPNATADSKKHAIDNVVNTYHALNLTVVASTSAQIPTTNTWKPPANAMEQLLREKLPEVGEEPVTPTPTSHQTPVTQPRLSGLRQVASAPTLPSDQATQAPPGPGPTESTPLGGGRQEAVAEAPRPQPAVNSSSPGESPPAVPLSGGRQDTGTAVPSPPPTGPLSPPTSRPPTAPPLAPTPTGPVAATPGGGQPGLPSAGASSATAPTGSPASPVSASGAAGSSSGGPTSSQTAQGAQSTSSPKADSLSGAAGPKLTGTQAPVQPPPTPLSNAAPATPLTPPAAPIEQAASSSPAAPTAPHPAAATGGGGMAPPSAPPPTSASPAPPMPLGAPSTPPPAAPVPPSAGSIGPSVMPASTNSAQPGSAAAAPIPVSAARAERDLAASAAAAGALRRKTGGNDPLSVARRIAAALNAPDMTRPNDIGFFWLVALTADDTIIVANSYGIAYLPDGVSLPGQVKMVSADASIPSAERARWATYPVAALTGWAQAHDTTLRAVIGAKAQLEGIDPGAHKVLLEDDDIPPSGRMTGRTRLEIISPDAAAKLAAVKDPDLVAQLPPAGADNTPPANDTFTLWFDVMQPLMSTASGREIAHLNAFVPYAAHAADLALYRAHTAPAIAEQRAAIADWLYWLHQYDLLVEAQATVTTRA